MAQEHEEKLIFTAYNYRLGWNGFFHVIIMFFVSWSFCSLFDYFDAFSSSRARVISLALVLISYGIWLYRYYKEVCSMPRIRGQFLSHARSMKQVDAKYQQHIAMIKTNTGTPNGCISEFMAIYIEKFENYFFKLAGSLLSHIVIIILVGTIFSYAVTYTSNKPSLEYKNLYSSYLFSINIKYEDALKNGELSQELKNEFKNHGITLSELSQIKKKNNNSLACIECDKIINNNSYIIVKNNDSLDVLEKNSFLTYLYFNTISVFTIGYGYIHPISVIARFGIVAQCFTIWYIIFAGVSHLIAFEWKRIDKVKEAFINKYNEVPTEG